MIESARGDILKAEADALVNPVNCVGAMGRGLAAQFKRTYPAMFDAYKAACQQGQVEVGRMFVFELERSRQPRFVINFPTKAHFRGKSQISYIESGLTALVDTLKRLEVNSVAIPPLGCGLGGLEWTEVRPRIEEAMTAVPHIRAILFEPDAS